VLGVSVEVGLAQRIASGHELWAARSSGSYRAVVRVIDYNRPTLDMVIVTVKDKDLVEAIGRQVSGDEAPLPADEAASYTIEALFDFASAQVNDLPYLYLTTGNGYRFTLSINPELGYIEEFKMDICGRGPLADKITECRWGFDVLDVHIGG